MADPRRRSPLSHRAPIEAPDGAARLAERPFLGCLVLRASADVATEAVRKVAGVGLPGAPNGSSRSGTATILWLGPDEWMLIALPGDEGKLLEGLTEALAGTRHQLVDVTDGYAAIELAGGRAREMLMKLTTLDLHPRAFRTGDVAGSMFGKVAARLHQSRADDGGDGPAFDLIVPRSTVDYLWCLLADAGRAFGLPEQEPVSGETWRP